MNSTDIKNTDKMKNIEIKDGVTLHYIEDNKFKTTTFGVYIHRPLCALHASENALLPMVLRRGSKNYPTFSDIEKRLGDLCGAQFDAGVAKYGEDQVMSFVISTVSDKYFAGAENLLDSCADLLFDIILNPKTENGVFCSEYTESEKRNLCEMIDALVNDKQSYALWRLYEVMCAGEAYGVHEYGTKEAAEKISAAGLYEHYKKVISESKIDIFVCGNADIDAFAEYVKEKLDSIKTSCADYPATEVVREAGSITRVTDEFDTSQAKLSLGFRITRDDIPYAHMLLANSIWGSGPHSKLFNNVREKLSLAYYAFSRFEKYKQCILVGMGIETKLYEKAFEETMRQLENVQRGSFGDDELMSAKAFLVNLFQSRKDSQYAMIDFYLSMLIGKDSYDIDGLCSEIENVSAQQAADAAKAIVLDTVYFLKGREV